MKALRHTFRIASIVTALAPSAFAVNSVVVESRDFEIGQTACTLGIWLTNDVPIAGLVLPVEARSLSGSSAFHIPSGTTGPISQPGRRLDASPLGSGGVAWPPASVTRRRYATPAGSCTGPVSHSWSTPVANVDGVSPDGFLYSCVSQGDANIGEDLDLDPGADNPSRDSASWVYVFNANNFVGCFEVDTSCVTPSGHISWVDVSSQLYIPEFTKGVVCLESAVNQAPILDCPTAIGQPKDPGESGAVVTYVVTYFDEDTTLVPVCNPPSGSFFPIGTTIVICVVTDTFGLADTCEFLVTVGDVDGNRVTVASDTFSLNQTACTVGVYLENVIPLEGLVLPLDIRTVLGGAFYHQPGTSFFSRQPGARLDLSPLGSADPGGDWPAAATTVRYYDPPAGPTCGPRTYSNINPVVGGTSPDAVLYSCVSQGDPGLGEQTTLAPGADPTATSSASWIFVFDANGIEGCFEIDTCCTAPSSHIGFLDDLSGFHPVGFTKGTVCLEGDPGVNYPPIITCPPIVWQPEEPGQGGAIVNFSVDVFDEDPALTAVSSPPSGAFFSLGSTFVTSIATDSGGLADTCMFEVVVHNATENSVAIESKTFAPGQTACTIAVYLENVVPVVGLVIPVEARTLTNNAFFLGGNPLSRLTEQTGQRFDLSPLGSEDPAGRWPAGSVTRRIYDTTSGFCSGPISGTYATPIAMTQGTSRDAWMLAAISQGDAEVGDLISLVPGADPPFMTSASFIIVLDMDTVEGCFAIDTCCVAPAGHLGFVDEFSVFYSPSFTKGTICISSCICDCHANPAVCSDPAVNVLDVISTINIAFRGFAEINDNHPLCPMRPTDLNCDGFTSIVDVIKMIDVAFRGANAATIVCDPCL